MKTQQRKAKKMTRGSSKEFRAGFLAVPVGKCKKEAQISSRTGEITENEKKLKKIKGEGPIGLDFSGGKCYSTVSTQSD